MDNRPQSAGLIATTVVMNIIWWMLMIAAIGLGAMHIDHCPVQPNVPVYLIVLGATSLLSLIFTYSSRGYQDGAVHILSLACMTVLHIFSFAWLIAGSSWIYAVYAPNYSGKERYCHKTTYLFAFVVTTLMWVAMTLILVCTCCFALLTFCTTIFAGRHMLANHKSFYGATSFHEPAAGDV
ncbi:transmembrane protein 272-like [Girardinichthys multiradiatus]|uniref:transmembrane protein 272-like n=1 Tax=Girardinichthys multiradiatus TaxID=208333 RepID=UPI001FAD0F48|nr:transmembrane protein 272-like [Girardinichthys multiradiatus]